MTFRVLYLLKWFHKYLKNLKNFPHKASTKIPKGLITFLKSLSKEVLLLYRVDRASDTHLGVIPLRTLGVLISLNVLLL